VLSKRPGSQLGSAARLRAVAWLASCRGRLVCPGNLSNPFVKNPAFEPPAPMPPRGEHPAGPDPSRRSCVPAGGGRGSLPLPRQEMESKHGAGTAMLLITRPLMNLISFSLPSQGPVTLSPSVSLGSRAPRPLVALLCCLDAGYIAFPAADAWLSVQPQRARCDVSLKK